MPVPQSRSRLLPAAACLVVGGACCAAGAQPAAGAEVHWNAITACASRTGERARHACVDDVLRAAGFLKPEHQVTEAQPVVAPGVPAPPPPAPPRPAPQDDRVAVQLATVTNAPDAKLILTTTDGAVWRQSDVGDIFPRPVAGDTLIIRKAALGSFLCKVGKSVAYRCYRSR